MPKTLNTYKPWSMATGRAISLPSFKAKNEDEADKIAKEMWIKEMGPSNEDPKYADAHHVFAMEIRNERREH